MRRPSARARRAGAPEQFMRSRCARRVPLFPGRDQGAWAFARPQAAAAAHSVGPPMRSAGADVRTVADLMGHSTTRTTQDTYQHPSDERKRAVAERVAAVIQAGGTQAAPKGA